MGVFHVLFSVIDLSGIATLDESLTVLNFFQTGIYLRLIIKILLHIFAVQSVGNRVQEFDR